MGKNFDPQKSFTKKYVFKNIDKNAQSRKSNVIYQ
jgi:hypothetical protein